MNEKLQITKQIHEKLNANCLMKYYLFLKKMNPCDPIL